MALWTPARLPTSLWFDASDAATVILNGSTVSQWNDKSGNYRNVTQGTASLQPTYTSNGLNSLSVVTWDGTGDKLLGSWSEVLTSRSVFIVFSHNGSGTNTRPFTQYLTGYDDWSTPGWVLPVARELGNSTFGVEANTVGRVAQAAVSWNVPILYTHKHSNTNNIITRINGGAQIATNSSVALNTTVSNFIFGTNPGSDDARLSGYIAECIVLDYDADIRVYQLVEGYLAHKWGLTANLPTNHLYKTTAPQAYASNTWTPELLDTELWLDASTPDAIISAKISAWNDKSGNNRHAIQGTSVSQPIIQLATLNNLPTIYFYDTFLSMGNVFQSVLSNADKVLLFTVHKVTATNSAGQRIIQFEIDATGDNAILSKAIAANTYVLTDLLNDGASQSAAHVTNSTWHIDTTVYEGGVSLKAYDFGSLTNSDLSVGSQLSVIAASSLTTIGSTAYSVARRYLRGNIAEIILVLNDISTNTREKIEGYLAHKWGLADNLSSEHAYKSSAPVIDNELWTPSELATELWLDAADSSTYTQSTVYAWGDKSGNNRHAEQPTTGSQPTYNASALNDKGGIVFDGTDDKLITSSFLNPEKFTGLSLFLLYKIQDTGSVVYPVPFSKGTVNTEYGLVYYYSTTELRWRHNDSGVELVMSGDYPNGTTPLLLSLSMSLDNMSAYYYGSSTGTYTPSSLNVASSQNSVFYIGGSSGGTNQAKITVYEIILTHSVLSIADQNRIEGYLAHKWGLTANLPSSHPYKTEPPFIFQHDIVDNSQKLLLSVDNTVLDNNITDFPLPIVLDGNINPTHNHMLSTVSGEQIGIKLRGVDLPIEIADWDTVNKKASLFVKVPEITPNASNCLELSYDYTQFNNAYAGYTGTSIAQSVWDKNFSAVYHMSQNPVLGANSILDSTVNVKHGNPGGSMTVGDLIEGLCGKALDFDGLDDYVQAVFTTSSNPAISILFSIPVPEVTAGIWTTGDVVIESAPYALLQQNSTEIRTYCTNYSSIYSLAANTWYYITVQRTSIKEVSLVNGFMVKNRTVTSLNARTNIYFGSGYDGYSNIKICEVFIHNTHRSYAWERLMYLALFNKLITMCTADSVKYNQHKLSQNNTVASVQEADTLVTLTTNNYIGNGISSNTPKMSIREVRISDVARSKEWLNATNASIKNNLFYIKK